ncbi:hypothetical protein [Algibacter sp. Ld11]|uniref:hypothetical protein n=1 Tax=Algibacter sp. Ld11 TaxID=649150 RepID=UPI00386F603E
MKLTEFFNDDFFSLPRTQGPKEDYKTFVNRVLNEFLKKIDNVENFEDVPFNKFLLNERQNFLVNQLKSTISIYYDGKPAQALKEIKPALDSNIKDFEDFLNVREFEPSSNFFRIRIHKHNYPLKSENFFHIPFDLRGKIKTQRFSIPGFPSLYLGNSAYVCWEELNRPNLNDFQIVRLKSTKHLKVIDLAPPKGDNIEPYEYYKYLMIWPIVFACSVRVRNYDDFFKPEYIIPQLLLQWVREDNRIDGISYQTTHINFTESLSEGEFLNIVLPVKENKTKGLCAVLESKFQMTEATSVQLNQCSTHGIIGGGGAFQYNNDKIKKIELIKGIPTDYNISVFGGLEDVLSKMECNKITKP